MTCGLHGMAPKGFPGSKPVYNMRGMGAGSRMPARARLPAEPKPGHMWTPLPKGDHLSTDSCG